MKNNYKVLTIKYCSLMSVYWALLLPLVAFSVPYLEEEGFSSMQISVINGCRYMSMIVFQYFLGEFADRVKGRISLRSIVFVLTSLGLVCTFILYYFKAGFFLTLIIFIIFGMTYGCLIPMIESMSLAYMEKGLSLNYAFARASGAVSYFIFSIYVGFLIEKYTGRIMLIFQAIFSVIMLINVFVMPDDRIWNGLELSEEKERKKKAPHTAVQLLRFNKKYRLYLLGCFFTMAGYGLNFAFLIDKVTLIGGTAFTLGIVTAVASLAEVPVEASFNKLRERFALDHLIVLFPIFCTLKALGTLLAGNSVTLITVQLFELFGMSIFYSSSLYFVKDNVPVEDQVKGMSLINMLAVGLGDFLSNFSAGFLKEIFGLQGLMIISVGVSAVGIIFILLMNKTPKIKETLTA